MSTPEQDALTTQQIMLVNERLDKLDRRTDERFTAVLARIERVRDGERERWSEFRREREEAQQWWLATGIKAAVVVVVLGTGISIGAAIESSSQPEPTKTEAAQ